MESRPFRPRGWFDWTAVAASVVVASAIPAYALVSATGVTPLGDDNFDTEFISAAWAWAWLLVLIPGVAAWVRPRVSAVLGVAVVVPQVVAAGICVGRYSASGWGDGLEVLAFLLPAGMVVLIAVQLVVAALVRRSRQARTAPPAP